MPVDSEEKSFKAVLTRFRRLHSNTNDCITYVDGWWTYRVCIGRDIRQFHADDGACRAALQLAGPSRV